MSTGVQLMAPAPEYDPAGQRVKVVRALLAQEPPALQVLQAVLPVWSW